MEIGRPDKLGHDDVLINFGGNRYARWAQKVSQSLNRLVSLRSP
jgi:hypothetical protein